MTNELKKLTRRTENEILKYFFCDMDMESIYVVGSMVKEDYQDRMDNDYDIRIICNEVNSEKINNFAKYLEELCKKISSDSIEVNYSCLDSPVNHKQNDNKKNLLIHAIIYNSNNINDILPLTHKYQYGINYKLIYGKDLFKEYHKTRYNLDDLVNGYEGLNYCIEMLKNKEYRYFIWDTIKDKCEFNYHVDAMSDDLIIESCCYSVNRFIENLMNYCKWEGLDIPENKMIFSIRLLGQASVNENTLFLLHGLFSKSESILKTICVNPLKDTIKLLEDMKFYINYLDSIFPYKEQKKILVKN